MKIEVNPFFRSMDKKMISPHSEWCIGKYPGLCTVFLKTSTISWIQKFMLYLAVIEIVLIH